MRITSDGKKCRTESELIELVSKYEASGMTQAVFCEREGVGLSSLHKWLKKYGRTVLSVKPKAKANFVEFVAGGGSPNGAVPYQIELELPHGIVLRLS